MTQKRDGAPDVLDLVRLHGAFDKACCPVATLSGDTLVLQREPVVEMVTAEVAHVRQGTLKEAARMVCRLCAEGGALVWTHVDACCHQMRVGDGWTLVPCTASAIWHKVMPPEDRVVAS